MTGVQSIRCLDSVSRYLNPEIDSSIQCVVKEKSKGFALIERRRLADYIKAYKEPRFPILGPRGTEALDHCAVFMEINV